MHQHQGWRNRTHYLTASPEQDQTASELEDWAGVLDPRGVLAVLSDGLFLQHSQGVDRRCKFALVELDPDQGKSVKEAPWRLGRRCSVRQCHFPQHGTEGYLVVDT